MSEGCLEVLDKTSQWLEIMISRLEARGGQVPARAREAVAEARALLGEGAEDAD